MSTFKVEVIKIDDVTPHPNADRLDLLKVKDWQCVSAKGNFIKGDLAIYFPIDSLLPAELEEKIFGADSKIKLNNSRVRTIKLRGAISQGLVVSPSTLKHFFQQGLDESLIGADFCKELGVTKYEPPVKLNSSSNPAATSKKQINPHFRKYTGIENAKNYPTFFQDGEEVSITEKIHGTNFRAGWVPFTANTLWKKVKNYLGLAPKWEFVYGSHNVQLQNKLLTYTGYYDTNVFAEAVKKYNLTNILSPGEVIYGEIYGDGIQKGYTYGCGPGERRTVFFDCMLDSGKPEQRYKDAVAFKHWADERQLPIVPELYRGPFNKAKVLELRDGVSVLASAQKVREGVIVKPLKEELTYAGRKVLKYVSDEYLLKNQDNETEAH